MSVGRICPQKGYDLAVPAIARLIGEGYPVRLYIIGEGQREYVQRLVEQIREARISDAVRFLGVGQNPYPLMRAADIYLAVPPVTPDEEARLASQSNRDGRLCSLRSRWRTADWDSSEKYPKKESMGG